MKIFVSHSSKFDYEKEIYQPIRNSVLNNQYEFFLPHENGLYVNTKQIIQSSDLMLAEVSHPSVGSSIEIGWGDAFGLPLVCVYQANTEPSSALRFLAGDFIEYDNPEDLLNKLEIYLKGLTLNADIEINTGS
jgi:hypothetical protein